MTSKKKAAGKPPAPRVVRSAPKTHAEAARLIADIGKLLRESDREAKRKAPQVARLKDAMQRILDEVAATQAPLLKEAERLAELVYAYATEHQAKLTEDGAYTTAKFSSGSTLVWYQAPRSVVILDEAAFVAEAEKGPWKEILLRTTTEPNREAMLLNEDVVTAMKTASIVRERRFEIRPGNTDSHMQLPDNTKTWLVVPPKKRKAAKKKAATAKSAKR